MQQKDLYKFISWFINGPDSFYGQTSLMIISKYKDFPDKSYIDVENLRHVQFYVTRFLISIIMMFGRNLLQTVSPPDVKFIVGIDQFGFVLSIFKQGRQTVQLRMKQNIQQSIKQIGNKEKSNKISLQVNQLIMQVFGKQYFKQQQKRNIQMQIQHGGAPPVECIMGLDISTAIVGVSIFECIKNKLVFLDAVLLTSLINKRKLQNTLINKIKLFKQYFQDVLRQKNIKITKLYIQQQRKRFGSGTTANTLNKLRKFNGMVSGYMFQRLKDLQQVSYINVRSRRKIVFGKRLSKDQSYEKFKDMYKDMMNEQYTPTTPKDSNKDKSDSFVIGLAGILGGGKIARKPKKAIKKAKNKTG